MELRRLNSGDLSITDEDFEMIKAFFAENNPKKVNEPENIKEDIKSFKKDIEKNLEDQEEGYQDAILILLQGINFFSRLIGEPEYEVTGLEEEVKEDKVENIPEKIVVIFAREKMLTDALKKAFSVTLNPGTNNYKFYNQTSPLLDDILAGEICGLISIHADREGKFDLKSLLQHDLKNREGWDVQTAQRYIFPPCRDFGMPHTLTDIIAEIWKMKNGEYTGDEKEEFSLQEALPSLKAHMLTLKRPVRVAVIDDSQILLDSMNDILDTWPNIFCFFILQRSGVPNLPEDIDIVLLDEALADGVKGAQIADAFLSQRFTGIIASISGGHKPSWATWHFQSKSIINSSFAGAKAFVEFMNLLLKKIT